MKNTPKKKTDKVLLYFSKFLKKEMLIYSALGIIFHIEDDDKNKIILNDNVNDENFDKKFSPEGIIPIFLEDINDAVKDKTFLNKGSGLPIVYSDTSKMEHYDSVFGIKPELLEGKHDSMAMLTVMSATMDYILENKIKETYRAKYGNDAHKEYIEKTPINVDLSYMYNNFLYKYNHQLLNMIDVPKEERVIHAKPSPKIERRQMERTSGIGSSKF